PHAVGQAAAGDRVDVRVVEVLVPAFDDDDLARVGGERRGGGGRRVVAALHRDVGLDQRRPHRAGGAVGRVEAGHRGQHIIEERAEDAVELVAQPGGFTARGGEPFPVVVAAALDGVVECVVAVVGVGAVVLAAGDPVHGERGLEGFVPPGRGGDGYATAADDERPTTGDLRLAVLRHEELGDLLGAARVPDQPHVLAAEVVGVDEVVDQLGEVVRFAVPVLPPGDGAGGVGGEHGDECVALRVRHLNEAAIPAERVRVGRVQVPVRAVAVEVHHQARPSGQPFTEDVKGAGEAAGVGELDVRCVDQLRRGRRARCRSYAGGAGELAARGVELDGHR